MHMTIVSLIFDSTDVTATQLQFRLVLPYAYLWQPCTCTVTRTFQAFFTVPELVTATRLRRHQSK